MKQGNINIYVIIVVVYDLIDKNSTVIISIIVVTIALRDTKNVHLILQVIKNKNLRNYESLFD